MKRGIVVTTSKATEPFLLDLLKSLEGCKYPILVVGNECEGKHIDITNDWNGFELGGILCGSEEFDEFVHLMDTCVIDDMKMFDTMFEHDGSMYLCDGFFSYLGKYQTDVLHRVGIPVISSKGEAIEMERAWNERYLRSDSKAKQFDPPLPIHTNVFEEKHGRRNMVLQNGFITKYKATWSL